MSKFSQQKNLLNLEEKLLFVATSIIPMFIYLSFIYYFTELAYSEIYQYLFPPKITELDMSFCGLNFHPFYSSGYIIFVALILTISSFSMLNKKSLLSIITLVLPIILIIWRAYKMFNLPYIIRHKTFFEFFTSKIEIVDFIFTLFISILLIWQFSIICRFVILKFRAKIPLR